MKTLIPYTICLSVVFLLAGSSSPLLENLFQEVREEIKNSLRDAGVKAEQYGNDACRKLLLELNDIYGKQYIKRETEILSVLANFVTGLDPVIHEGVNELTGDFHTTLDELDGLLDSVRSLSFLQKSHVKLTSRVNQIIDRGRKATTESSVELNSRILHIMGEYFKGFVSDYEIHHGRSAEDDEREQLPEALEGMLAVVRDTFDIIDRESNKLLGKLDSIGGVINNSVEEAWTVLKRARPHAEIEDLKLLLQSIFDTQMLKATPGLKTGSIEDSDKLEQRKQ